MTCSTTIFCRYFLCFRFLWGKIEVKLTSLPWTVKWSKFDRQQSKSQIFICLNGHRSARSCLVQPKITQPRHFWTLFEINHTNYDINWFAMHDTLKRLVANTFFVAPPQFEIFTWFLTFVLKLTEAEISLKKLSRQETRGNTQCMWKATQNWLVYC